MNENTAEHNNCPKCHTSSTKNIFSAQDFDTSTETYSIQYCESCALAFTSICLNPEQLSRYYKKSYYGNSDNKFNGIIETLTRYCNHLRAKKILATIKKTRKAVDTPY